MPDIFGRQAIRLGIRINSTYGSTCAVPEILNNTNV